MPGESVDHVPPRSVRAIILQEGAQNRWPFVEVPACLECNCFLGSRPPWSLAERKVVAKQKIKRRYARFLAIPKWTPEELEKYPKRGVLRGYIDEGIILRDATELRLKW